MTSLERNHIQQFEPTIPDDDVRRLWNILKDTRLPQDPIFPNAGIDVGPPLPWIQKLLAYWTNEFDWPTAYARISSWPHFTTRIEGQTIHFVHKRASMDDSGRSIPLLLVHGWPGSFYEFNRIIDPLSKPSSTPCFDVIVPSLPGFCWSQGDLKDWTLQDTARIFDTLMKELGYDTYTAHGGDWGHWVVRELGARFSNSCLTVHTNKCPSVPPVGNQDTQEGWTEREKIAQAMSNEWIGSRLSYAIQMRSRPQTIGIALYDSPLGLMMWVGEKYRELVDPRYRDLDTTNPDVKRFVDDVCTTLSLYFFTPRTILTSTLCYYNNVRHENYIEFNTRPENLIKAPFGFSSFRWDNGPMSKRAVATTGNCQWYKEYDYGGHFAALEVPEELTQDLRDCFGELYQPEDHEK